MSENILESYLVKLGATEDTVSINKFNAALKGMGGAVNLTSLGIVKDFAKWEGAIVGAFGAVGAGMIGLADRAATADQQYRLFGLSMLMGKDQARAMSQALDTLGATMDQVAFDPELNARFLDLMRRNIELGKALGPNYDRNMRSIRGLKVEFKQLGNEVEALAFGSISDLFTKLGFGSGDAQEKLRKLNDWFVENIPGWADKVSTLLMPVWEDFNKVMGQTGTMAELAATDFTRLIGILSGDKSIQGTQFDVENLGKALVHTADFAEDFSEKFSLAFKTVSHEVMGVSAWLAYLNEQLVVVQKDKEGDKAGAADARKVRDNYWNVYENETMAASRNVADVYYAGKPDSEYKDSFMTNPDMQEYLHPSNSPLSSTAGEHPKTDPTSTPAQKIDLAKIIADASATNGIDPSLLASVIKQESHGVMTAMGPRTRSGEHAAGLMQLMPKTQREFGVSDPFDPKANVDAGSLYLGQLLRKYDGQVDKALAAFNWGQGNVDRKGMDHLPSETKSYIDNIMRDTARGEASKGDVIIQSMTITVPPGTSESRMKSIIADSMRDVIGRNNQRLTAEVGTGAYY